MNTATDPRDPLARADEIVSAQEEAVAFECARECISDMMSIYTGRIAEEEAKPKPDRQDIEVMRAERSRLARGRAELRLHDRAHITRIMDEYGGAVRAWRAEHRPLAA
ncbi:MAG: hypothetical protein C0607_03535 [Azoarcus sp.]|nr:MAG: hypothetical protein C0607_03535 [Azoarcus sp.]